MSRRFIFFSLALSAMAAGSGYLLARHDRVQRWRAEVGDQMEAALVSYQENKDLDALLHGAVAWRCLAEVTVVRDRLEFLARAGDVPVIAEAPASDDLLAAVGEATSWTVAANLQAFAAPIRNDNGRTISLLYGETKAPAAINSWNVLLLAIGVVVVNASLLFWPRRSGNGHQRKSEQGESPSVRTITLRAKTGDEAQGSQSFRAGMTLIELMIGASIVSVLTALLMPCISTTYRLAVRTSCSNNLRQVGAVVLLYAGENDDFLPAAKQLDKEDENETPAWFRRLPPYLGMRNIKSGRYFQCAGYKGIGSPTVFTNATPKSFKMNGLLERKGRCRFYKLGSTSDEATLALFVDGVAKETGMGQWGHAVESSVDDSRHRGSANVLFCDGHTQAKFKAPKGAKWDNIKWESDDWK